jgi:glycosyltransferase involved in cell wall biosynthesis
MKVVVCIPTTEEREQFFGELLDSLNKQTFTDFNIQTVKNIKPVGKAKRKVVELALNENPKYICMIDDDDLVMPTYLEKVVERLDKGNIDWCFTWGILFGEKGGVIHGEIQTPEQMIAGNCQPAWVSAKADVFRKENYDETVRYAEDMDLWLRLYEKRCKGDVIKEGLYLKRSHSFTVSNTEDLWKQQHVIIDRYRVRNGLA